MLLALDAPGGQRNFWVSRQLWVALLHGTAGLAEPVADEAITPPSGKPAPISAEDSEGATMLEGVQFKKNAEGAIVLVFQSRVDRIPLVFKQAGLARFRRMLETQADRAGWDAPAAMERLAAARIAGAAVRRAGQ